MGKPSTQAKQRWNEAHYKQVKVSVAPETATGFKAACESSNVSMASEISNFMKQYIGFCTNKGGYSPDLSTRRKRRAAVAAIILQLERIRDNEERYLSNIPDNLQSGDAFDNAEECLSSICEAIDLLQSLY